MNGLPCSCDSPGWCSRHQRHKTPYLYQLCQSREDYRALWDRLVAEAPAEPPDVTAAKKNRAQTLQRYATAVVRWYKAGRPVRSAERVREIYETVCQPCPRFDPVKRTCTICGCRVRASGAALLNKLRMATERCPDTPPRFLEEVRPPDDPV